MRLRSREEACSQLSSKYMYMYSVVEHLKRLVDYKECGLASLGLLPAYGHNNNYEMIEVSNSQHPQSIPHEPLWLPNPNWKGSSTIQALFRTARILIS